MEYSETCFAVIGDIHYFNAHASAQERMRALREDLRKKKFAPDLICQVGDVIENQEGSDPVSGEEGARQWLAALRDIKEVFPDIPFLITPGNHDWYGNNTWFGGSENLKRYLLPFLDRTDIAPEHYRKIDDLYQRLDEFFDINDVDAIPADSVIREFISKK